MAHLAANSTIVGCEGVRRRPLAGDFLGVFLCVPEVEGTGSLLGESFEGSGESLEGSGSFVEVSGGAKVLSPISGRSLAGAGSVVS